MGIFVFFVYMLCYKTLKYLNYHVKTVLLFEVQKQRQKWQFQLLQLKREVVLW